VHIACDELRDLLSTLADLDKPANFQSELNGIGNELTFGKSLKPELDTKIYGLRNFPKSSDNGAVATFGFGAKAPPLPSAGNKKAQFQPDDIDIEPGVISVKSDIGPDMGSVREKKRKKSRGILPEEAVSSEKKKKPDEDMRLKRQRSESRVKSLLWKFETKSEVNDEKGKKKAGEVKDKKPKDSPHEKKSERPNNIEDDKKKNVWSFLNPKDDDSDEEAPDAANTETPMKTTPPFAPSPQLASMRHVSVSGSYSSTASVLELPPTA